MYRRMPHVWGSYRSKEVYSIELLENSESRSVFRIRRGCSLRSACKFRFKRWVKVEPEAFGWKEFGESLERRELE